MSDGKKKGIMGFLENVGIVETTPDAPAPPARTTRNTPIPAAPAPHFAAAPTNGVADPEVLGNLERRLQKNCPAAYTSFMEQYENLKEVIPDDSMRFKAALKASHTTAEALVDALTQLAGVMDTAGTEFTHTYEEMRRKKLGEAEALLKSTDEQITSYEAQLKSIQETIASLRTKRSADEQAMQAEAGKIETTRANFEAAHAQVVGRLNAQKSRVLAMPRT